jgi:pyruvate formate-lyase/glycerol dehydratase family glycyl radical enzyme
MAEPALALDPKRTSERFERIRDEILSSPLHLCPERALLITDFFKHHDDPTEPMVVRKAKALRHFLLHKSVIIRPEELIVGNVGTQRRSVLMHPEMAGVFLSEELLWMDKRKTAPLAISWRDRLKLATSVMPYWLPRNMVTKAFSPNLGKMATYTAEQLSATYYLINESNGIGHLIPDYEKMLKLGVQGYLRLLEGRESHLHRAMRIAMEGLTGFSNRLAQEAELLASQEQKPERVAELREIARICLKVPNEPAETFHEALQALWLTHLAINVEGLNSAVSFGRVDQYLYPYFREDVNQGRITPESAKELILCFNGKCDEHFYLLSERISVYHGGLLVVQGVTLGGMDRNGNDAVNDLTYVFLDAVEESGLKEPNYQARIHAGSPQEYVNRVVDVARQGSGMPALFNDEACIRSLVTHGYPLHESRDYGVVGCVELGLPGKSFFSTDAALFSLPACLELALNGGKRFNSARRVGVSTPQPALFTGMDQVLEAFRVQVEHMAEKMINDLRAMEEANRDFHPTPFTSMLVEGCIESDQDVTQGGAQYNHSGVQGVGVADVADSLSALDTVVFRRKKYSMAEVLEAMLDDFVSYPKIRAGLLNAPKFGNDHQLPDGYANTVVRIFHSAVTRHANTRGGPYVPGFYSDTSYVGFGRRVSALPSGRKAGEPLASSLSPATGHERLGPTAVLNSVARVDSSLSPNGYALNMRFDPHIVSGDKGMHVMSALVRGYFDQGGMELQLNVIAPETLEDALNNPGKYPGLLVRVAGYCAYFDDLPYPVRQEIVARTRLTF